MSDSENGFQFKWVLVSIVIMFLTQGLLSLVFGLLGVLTLGIGFILFLVIKPLTYFAGGYITGRVSPGITIIEPAIGAVVITVIGVLFDSHRLFAGRLLSLIISGVIACAAAIFGAALGEKAQAAGE
ncbi:MAG: hypothetical protein JW874_04180 [Spirochaetales bacterium]|nr:hypothetical protein [Spirochaetales bacterium]